MKQHDFILEICLDSVESALIAQEAGADRIELCAGLSEGGLTPSLGLVKIVHNLVKIPVYVMIRPRRGDFCYTENEFSIMKTDIQSIKDIGVAGIVLGILKLNGTVDIERTKILVELASPMQVTFHRAFDVTVDPFQALEDVISTGAHRLLTSGQKQKAIEGTKLIKELIKISNKRINIMAGSGLDETSINQFISMTGATEIHMSASRIQRSAMHYQKADIFMSKHLFLSEYELLQTDYDKIKRIKEIKL